MKILGTGLTGLVGSRFIQLLKDYQFENLSRETGVDILNREVLEEKVKNSNASVVLHFAAKTDVDECENDKILGENGEAWKINVLGTKNIVDSCLLNKKRLISISTDFVFDGEKNSGYVEEDIPNPINWYGRTKYEGEKLIQNSNLDWTIVRIAYPYRSNFPKKDFVRNISQRLKEGNKVQAVINHVMTPTFIDDIVEALNLIIKTNVKGIFHVVGSQFISPFDASTLIAKTFGFDTLLVDKITCEEYFKNRAIRPFYLGLKNDKIQKLGIKMKSFEQGLKEIKKQILL